MIRILRALSFLQRIYNIVLIFLYGSKGYIYVFHEIGDERTITDCSCYCSTDKFEKFLDALKSESEIVYIDAFIDGKLMCEKKMAVISFDDVPESVYINAYPILCEKQIPFVLYLSPKFIGQDGFLTSSQIYEMIANPLCTIGAHTMEHTNLRKKTDSYSDMYNSKVALERFIGKNVSHLSYPYGRADSISCKVRKEAKKAGFKSAVCTIPTAVPNKFDQWYIPRVAEW